MKLTGPYAIVVTGDISKLGIGFSHDSIGYLFQRLLTGDDANMANLDNLGITVRFVGEDDEFIAIRRDAME